MINYTEKVGGTWIQIAVEVDDYMVQCKGKGSQVLLVKASSGEPTDSSGAFELYPGDVVASTILTGNIWVRALADDVLIAYAK